MQQHECVRPHVKIVQHPESQCRSYHFFAREVAAGKRQYFFRDSLFSAGDVNPLREIKGLGKRLAALPGVAEKDFGRCEVFIDIGRAFRWKEVGPLILGELVRVFYPEAVGKTLEVSVSVGFRNGHSVWYEDLADHAPIGVVMSTGYPILNLERLFEKKIPEKAE